jgi:hypothetical protein
MKNLSLSLLALTIIVSAACNKNEQGSYRLNVMAKSVKSGSATFQMQSASCYITEVELEADDDDYRDDEDQNEIDLEGRFFVDLLTGISTPELPVIDAYENDYEELEIEFGEDDDKGIYAFNIKGQWNDGTNDIPVTIQVDDELSYEVEDDNGITISESLTRDLIVMVDLEGALSNLDFGSATIQNDEILIDDSNNTNLYSDFINSLLLELDD